VKHPQNTGQSIRIETRYGALNCIAALNTTNDIAAPEPIDINKAYYYYYYYTVLHWAYASFDGLMLHLTRRLH